MVAAGCASVDLSSTRGAIDKLGKTVELMNPKVQQEKESAQRDAVQLFTNEMVEKLDSAEEENIRLRAAQEEQAGTPQQSYNLTLVLRCVRN